MIVRHFLRWCVPGGLAGTLRDHVGACLLGGAALWWVAAHAGPQTGTVVIHVNEPQVVIGVDAMTFPVEHGLLRPLVCDLPAGEHRLTMRRGGTVLYEEGFSLEGGEHRVLVAWAQRAPGAARGGERAGAGVDAGSNRSVSASPQPGIAAGSMQEWRLVSAREAPGVEQQPGPPRDARGRDGTAAGRQPLPARRVSGHRDSP